MGIFPIYEGMFDGEMDPCIIKGIHLHSYSSHNLLTMWEEFFSHSAQKSDDNSNRLTISSHFDNYCLWKKEFFRKELLFHGKEIVKTSILVQFQENIYFRLIKIVLFLSLIVSVLK